MIFMSTNNIEPIQRFLERVRQASKTGAKDIRLTTNEATEIAASLAQILLSQSTESLKTESSHAVVMDGGTFE